MKLLILGVNGFIGSHLAHRALADTDWEIYGMDLASDRLEALANDSRFHFLEGDISINKEWIEYHVKKCDVCLPLVAIATPASYIRDPLAVFELDFEQNLRIVRQCAHYGTRVIFPSTSEVYGMCPDEVFDPEKSPCVYGPIHKQRWIYACAKQMMDRVIWAMGRDRGLQFTLIRPFNWIGPGLDCDSAPKEGSSPAVAQFLGNIFRNEPITLIDGGHQRRCFIYVEDGLDCLLKIIKNKGGKCNGKIFNIGNPYNDYSIRELAEMMVKIAGEFSKSLQVRNRFIPKQHLDNSEQVQFHITYNNSRVGEEGSSDISLDEALRTLSLVPYPEEIRFPEISARDQDIEYGVPDITNAQEILGWEPMIPLDEALRLTIAFYLNSEDFRPKWTAIQPSKCRRIV
jgi:nucleoside-diphosphate-sugar epimerase